MKHQFIRYIAVTAMALMGLLVFSNTIDAAVSDNFMNTFTAQGDFFDIEIDANGDYIVLGTGPTITAIDDTGAVLWSQVFGSTSTSPDITEIPSDLRITSDGGYLVSGDYHSNISHGMFIYKLDSAAEVEWARYHELTTTNHFISHTQTGELSNGYVLLGEKRAPVGVSNALYVLKFDMNGNQTSSNQYYIDDGNNGSSSFELGALLVQPDDSLVVSGTGLATSPNAIILKIDANDVITWNYFYGLPSDPSIAGYGFDSAVNMHQTNDGGFALVGTTASFGPGRQALLIKTDSNGVEEWTTVVGPTLQSNEGTDVTELTNGNFVITGYTNVINPNTSIFAAAVNSDGEFQWYKEYGTSGPELGKAITAHPEGGFAIVGQAYLHSEFGDYKPLILQAKSNGEIVGCDMYCSTKNVSITYAENASRTQTFIKANLTIFSNNIPTYSQDFTLTPVLLCGGNVPIPFDCGPTIPQVECNALEDFYQSTNGDSWTTSTNWMQSGVDACTWHGVSCVNGHVSSLSHMSNNLTGTLPESIGDLAELKTLIAYDNDLTGEIPSTIGNLSDLEVLRLDRNQLSGSIPSSIVNVTNLEQLYLYGNSFSRSIPADIGNLNKLKRLYLNSNDLSGSIPDSIGSMSALEYMYLHENDLSDSIPDTITNLSNLEVLVAYTNDLTGSLPANIGNMSNLRILRVDRNQLSGSIPASITNLTDLEQLYLYDNNVTGSIPSDIGNLTNLVWLYLNTNDLSGSIPDSIGNMTQLKYLYLYDNNLSGSIPNTITNLSNLEVFIAYTNELTGTLPADIGNLTALKTFRVDRNELSGIIPSSITDLVNLEKLYLYENMFTGTIPADIGNLTNLQRLYVLRNGLTGEIPTSITSLNNLVLQQPLIGENGLYTSDSGVQSFLDVRVPGWDSKQTIAPTNIVLTEVSSTSITIDWDTIPFTTGVGYYEVLYSTTPGSGYISLGVTTDKTIDTFTATGLPDGVPLYVVVRTVTAANGAQQNEITSEYSSEVSITTTPLP